MSRVTSLTRFYECDFTILNILLLKRVQGSFKYDFEWTILEGSDIANQKWRSNTTALNVERGRERYQIEFPSFSNSKGNVILIVAVVGARERRIKWIFA